MPLGAGAQEQLTLCATEDMEGNISEMLTLDLIMLVGCTGWALWQYRRTKILLTPSNAFLVSTIILPVFVAYPLALSPESLSSHRTVRPRVVLCNGRQRSPRSDMRGNNLRDAGVLGCPAPVPRLAGKPRELPRSPRVSLNQLTMGACAVCLIGVASVWFFFIKEWQIPLLSSAQHSREVLEMGHPLRYIYTGGFTLANTGAVFLMGGLSLGKIRAYRPLCFFAITALTITNLCTASRGNLLAPFVSAGLIYFSLKNTKLTPFRALILAVLLLCSASALQLIRSHAGLSLEGLW